MLKGMMDVLYDQRRYVKGDKRYEEAWKSGVRFSQAYYGRLLAVALGKRIRAGNLGRKTIEDLLYFLRYYPQGLLTPGQQTRS